MLIARIQAKLLLRSALGRFFFLIISVFILFYIGFYLSTLNPVVQSGELYMASLFPYMIAFLFILLQYLPLVFFSTLFFSRGKIDTLDSLYVRPVSNTGYYTGVAIGFIRVFMAWATLLFFLGMLVHVFASRAPFNPWLYLYYLITLVFPVTVFMLGFSFFVSAILRHAFASIVVVFGCIWVTFSLSGESWWGLFNFSGFMLPNEYSEMTGFADVVPYLFQRVGWLLAGVGLFFFSILFFKRLDNSPEERRSTGKKAWGILLAGIVCLLTVQGIYMEKYARRSRYAGVYDEYANHGKLYLLSQDLDITPDGCRLNGLSRMRLVNNSGESLSDFLLYLNPSLNVKSLRVEGDPAPLSFRREKQVIIVEKGVAPDDTLRLEMEYEGGIDENVFYLDVPEREIRDTWTCSYARDLYPRGKRYAYLEDNQVLLNPEGLWYPVSVAPVNPASPYAIEKNFTDYTLTVHGIKDRVVISQGERHVSGETVMFKNNYSLPGISLCIGDYERRSLRLGSVDYELYLYKGHGIFVEAYEEILDSLSGSFSRSIEYDNKNEFNQKYPFNRLLFVEMPRTFATYCRNQKGGSEYVQPEIVYIPERMLPRWMDRWELNEESEKQQNGFLYGAKGMKLDQLSTTISRCLNNEGMFLFPSSLNSRLHRLITHSAKPEMSSNPFFVGSLFYNHVYSFYSLDNPFVEILFNALTKNSCKSVSSALSFGVGNYRESVRFLGTNSLKDAFLDAGISPELMRKLVNLKTDELFLLLDQRGVSKDKLAIYLREYTSRKCFRHVDIDEFTRDMKRDLGVDLLEILPGWFRQNRLPSFIVEDIEMKHVGSTGHLYDDSDDITWFTFTVYNDSDTDGIVTLSCVSANTSDLPRNYYYRVPAREGRKISRTVYGNCFEPALKLNLSQNYPVEFPFEELISSSSFIDTTYREEKIGKEDLLPPGEVVVDNVDAGFSYSARELSFTERWKRKRQGQALQERDRMSLDWSNPDWQILIDRTTYGYPVRSTVARLATNSDSKVSWTAELQREGYYDVSVYVPSGLIKQVGSYVVWKYNDESKDGDDLSFSQYYTVDPAGELKEISIEVPKKSGWVSLGKFYYSSGKARVFLLDKGEDKQLVCADAVKWRYLGDKKE